VRWARTAKHKSWTAARPLIRSPLAAISPREDYSNETISHRRGSVCRSCLFSACRGTAIQPRWKCGGVPGPNPGGPGLTPYTTGPGQAPPYYAPPPAQMAPAAAPPASTYEPSAPPASYSSQRRRGRAAASSADISANQLNRQELDRLQAQNYRNFPPPGYAPPSYPPQPYPPMAYPPTAYPPMGTTGGGVPYRP
jgi:hypothetical protein